MLKRIRRELELWPYEKYRPCLDNDTLTCHDEIIDIPSSYPFSPPKIRNIQYITTHISPEVWCLVLLSNPYLYARYTTWNIPCTCCHALTCPGNWNTSYRLHQVWEDARFHTAYNRLRNVKFPRSLPIDVMEHMVMLATRTI